MTTGTKTIDLRVYAGVALGNQGVCYKRVYAGQDSVAPITHQNIVVPEYRTNLLGADGKPFVIPSYVKRQHLYRQKHRLSENPYTWDISTQRTGEYLNNATRMGIGDTATTIGVPAPSNGVSTEPLNLQLWTGTDDLRLLNSLRKSVMGSDFNAAAFLGTSLQSLEMIASLAFRLRMSMNSLRKGNIADAAKLLTAGTRTRAKTHHRNHNESLSSKDLASAQLELSYGWLPLLSDCESGAQYVAHNTAIPRVHRVRGTYSRDFSSSIVMTNYTQLYPVAKEGRAYGKYIVELDDGFDFDAATLSGLTDPLSMAWETLPWSFVVDWFIPIQNYLQNRSFVRATRVKTCTKITGYRFNVSRVKGTGLFGYFTSPYDMFYYRWNKGSRTVTTSIPEVKFPAFKPLQSVPSWQRALNGVSLLVQRHGSHS